MATATLPTYVPVEIVEERSIMQRYILSDTKQTNKYGEDETAALDIRVSHDKGRKAYTVRFYRVLLSGHFVRWSMELRNEDPQPVTDYIAEYAARFSAKRLREVFDAAIVRHTDEDIAALLSWAERVTGRTED